jgi:acetyl esterase/lipase
VVAAVARQRVDLGKVRGEWFIPPGAARPPSQEAGVVLHFHGGGYVIGSVHGAREFLARLAGATGLPVLSVDYRLAPEHPFPAAVEDALAAHRWLVASGQRPDRIVLVGDEAGGGLTLALLFALRDRGEVLPRGAALLCPWVELGSAAASYQTNAAYDILLPSQLAHWAAAYLGRADPDSPLVSPLRGDFSGLPPLLFHVGGAELFLDDVTAAAQKARAAGVAVELEVFPDMFHVWHAFATVLPEGARAMEQVADFVRRRMA